MIGGMLNLAQAAEHVHLTEAELKHAAQRGELVAQERAGGEWYFDHRALDEWAQRNLLSSNARSLKEQHRVMMDEDRRADKSGWGIGSLFAEDTVELSVTAKGKAGVIRDMTDLANRGGKVYDVDGLYQALVEREQIASTAIAKGVALLHPRFHDPYLFEESFVAYGRTERPVFFGADDGEGTRHFFLICSTDHELHLHILARLAMLVHGSDLVSRLEEAEDFAAVMQAIDDCEAEYRK